MKLELCKCGALRRPGEVSQTFALVNCTRCGLWIAPPDADRIKFILSGGYQVRTERTDNVAKVVITDHASKIELARGTGPTLGEALSSLSWEILPRFGMSETNDLNKAGHYSPTSGPVPNSISHLGTVTLCQHIGQACQDMSPAPWTVEAYGMAEGAPIMALHDFSGFEIAATIPGSGIGNSKDLNGLAFIRQAAPILAERTGHMLALFQGALDLLDYCFRGLYAPGTGEKIKALLEDAKAKGFEPGGSPDRPEGAPYCPNCSSFMRPWPLKIPDPKSGQSGYIPGHLVKMKTVHAWRCNCEV